MRDAPELPRLHLTCEALAVISTADCLWYIDEALTGMVRIVTDLGEDLANRAPDLPGANSPFAILTHCLGVLEDWGGSYIAGRVISRDRDSEFRAVGSLQDLAARAQRSRDQLRTDLVNLDPGAPVLGVIDPVEADLPFYRSQGGALIHIYEELAKHNGQMEITRDLLVAPWVRLAGDAN
jgi:hypothetical protein